MPQAEFGTPLNFQGSKFIKLKNVGDSLHFRILAAPHYEGKHFFKTPDDKWDVQACPRINEKAHCNHCDQYFRTLARLKKAGDTKAEEAFKKNPKGLSAAISFYYPVLRRDSEEFAVFQTTKSVRDKIETEITLGTKVLERDWVVSSTNGVGANKYAVTKLDSSETKELSDREKEVIEKAKSFVMEDYINGASDDESGTAYEANSEVVSDTTDPDF